MAETSTQREYSGIAGEWLPLPQAAKLLGVSRYWLSRWISGAAGPILENRGRRVRPGQAYDHIIAHAKRRPPTLQKPLGYESTAGSQSDLDQALNELDPAIKAALEVDITAVDLHELVVKLVASGASDSKIRACSTAANAIQKKRADTARAGKNVPPEDVVRMLRAHGELYVQEIEASASRFASELLDTIRKQLGPDLAKSNPAAAEILANSFLEVSNSVILSVRKKIEDQVHGVQILEGTA